MKRISLILIFGIITIASFSQTYSPEIVSLGNFVRRMIETSSFEGVKVVEDYDNSYLISVVILEKEKYSSETIMNKVAMTKARSNVSKFMNGSEITTDFIIRTEERKSDTTQTETITYDIIREKSMGMVDAMETLITFNISDNKKYVFVMFKKYEDKTDTK